MEVREPEVLKELFKKIKEKTGFDHNEYSQNFFLRRLEVRLRYNNITSYKDYIPLLEEEEEQKKLLKELKIHVTHFFRDISFYEAFRKEIIPEIIKKDNKKINIWSAGVSSGEEACSIMICFYEELGDNLRGFEINIRGSDYDEETIQKAKIGAYEEQQFKETPEQIKKKYFEKKEDSYYVSEKIKKHIKYEVEDIIRTRPADIDIILCRNTVIYFKTETKTKLYDDFYEILNPEGFLVLGKTETMSGEARNKFKTFNARERTYKK